MPVTTRERTLRAAALCAGLLVAAAPLCPASSDPIRQPLEPLDFTGRTFSGLRLPVAPGGLAEQGASFGASQAWAWREPAETDAAGIVLPPVSRLLLVGDVSAHLGIHRLTAARAMVWMRRLDPADVGGEEGLAQVYVFFDRVATPTAAPGEGGAISFNADRLAVEGVFKVTGEDLLRTDALSPGPPEQSRFILEGEQSLAQRLRRLVENVPEPSPIGVLTAPPGPDEPRLSPPGQERPFPGMTDSDTLARLQELDAALPIPTPAPPIFAKEGVFTIVSGNIVGIDDQRGSPDAAVAMVTDGVDVQYHDAKTNQNLLVHAERGVVYFAPNTDAGRQRFETREVLGIYVEGDVMATDAEYTIRAPRMYYDVELGRALVLDAVFSTYDARLGVPLYIRAKTIRQESSDQFKAKGATVSNTAFFEPHFSVGATSITISRTERTRSGWLADARNITINAGIVPFFYWPIFYGDPRNIPLRAVEVIGSSVSGAGVRTAWHIPTLLGIRNTRGVSAQLLLDVFFDRGLGVGSDIDWENASSLGSARLYMLPEDRGTDSLAPGTTLDHDGDFRGIALIENRSNLNDVWTLFLEGSAISDETFVDAFMPELGFARREPRNSALLRWLNGPAELTAQLKGSIDDFTPSEHLLQSQGYTVDKLPEVTYTRVGDDLLATASPGLLTYFSETRLGQVAFNFTESAPSEFGFDTNGLAQRALGIPADTSIGDSLRAEGLSEKPVTRFDTRHELTVPLNYGAFNVTPFGVGRFTAYDQDFESFSGNDDQTRLWGEVGVRVATTVQRIDDSVRSRFFDVNRIRHIVTPSVSTSVAGTTLAREDLPVYDDSVEDINDGTTVRFGIDQTWQTKRGGPGRERTVDWITLDTELVFNSGRDFEDAPYPRHFDYRPELSSQGDYVGIGGTWLATEVLGFSAGTAYDLNTSQQTRTAVGMMLQHSQDFSTFVDLLYSNPHDQTFLSFGAAYRLSDKYDVAGRATYDQELGDFQNLQVNVSRLYPNIWFDLGLSYNNIRGETSFSFGLRPVGLGQRGATLRGLGSSNERARQSVFGG